MLEVMMVDDGGIQESLQFNADYVRRFTSVEPRIISIHHLFRPERLRVEAYLETAYDRAFKGLIRNHYPTLMSIQDREGNIHAAVGFRFASQGPLFLEQYLDGPIETAVAQRLGGPVDRAVVAEIGNLASNSPGASLFLFMALARHLDRQGASFAVATATSQLRRSFARVGFDTEPLARADAGRLADGAGDWGAYYSRDPEVLAGAIGPALSALDRMLAPRPELPRPMVSRLHPNVTGEAGQ